MSTYSVDGYLAALAIREVRTLLVEGRDDKRFLLRVMHELIDRGLWTGNDLDVDTAEMLRGDAVPMGNRHLVELTHTRARVEGLPLAALVDREFRDFIFDPPLSDSQTGHNVIDESLFWTRGHSIENYAIDVNVFNAFLRDQFPEYVTGQDLAACGEGFEDVVTHAVALTLAAREERILEKLGGVVKHRHWTPSDIGRVRVDIESVVDVLRRRNIGEERLDSFRRGWQRWQEALVGVPFAIVCRVGHGHLSWEVAWSGVGALLRERGAARHVVDGVAAGYAEAKWRHASSVMARRIVWDGADILSGIWRWVIEGHQPTAA